MLDHHERHAISPVVHHIASLEDDAIRPYRTLRRPLDHRREGVFVAEGARVVRRLLESPLTVRSLLLTPSWYETIRPALIRRPEPDIFLAGPETLEAIIGYRYHQGIMALADVPPEPDPGMIPPDHVVVALDGLHHAENVGVAVRNAAALGADALITGETSASPFLRRAVRNSMGAVFRLPVYHPPVLVEFLGTLIARRGTAVIAADPGGAVPVEEAAFGGPVCLVVGNEEGGVSPEILALCRARVRIPMDRDTDSVNVASALAVLLYAIRRWRADASRPGPR